MVGIWERNGQLLTVMVKREPGFNRESGDWEYLTGDGAGANIDPGGKTCQACHEKREDAEDILREAARLRANHKALKTPDAIHAATAIMNGCALFVTNDYGFRQVPGLPLAVLDDILAQP